MPAVDVTDIVLDPDFSEALTVYRRAQVIDNYGVAQTTPTLVTPAPYGVVEPQGDDNLEFDEDYQDLPQVIEVHTPFRLRSAGKDTLGNSFQPDVILWNDTHFLVMFVANWSRYGRGFIRAVCASTDSIDLVPQ